MLKEILNSKSKLRTEQDPKEEFERVSVNERTRKVLTDRVQDWNESFERERAV